jgi:hypothetical protein
VWLPLAMRLFRRKVAAAGPPPESTPVVNVEPENKTRELLLTSEELPTGFSYPRGLLRLVDLELFELEPWWILAGDGLRTRSRGMAKRYPKRRLLPFARRQDNDDVACWDLDTGKVAIVHDFASPGWEAREEFPDFNSWLHSAIDDLIEF